MSAVEVVIFISGATACAPLGYVLRSWWWLAAPIMTVVAAVVGLERATIGDMFGYFTSMTFLLFIMSALIGSYIGRRIRG